MRKVSILTLIILLFLTNILFSQILPSSHEYEDFMTATPNALGVFIIGGENIDVGGLHYQRWFSNNIGLTLNGGGTYSINTLDYSVAAEIQYMVYHETFNNYIASGLYLWSMTGHRGYMDGATTTTEFTYKADFYAGLGIGIECIFWKHFSIPLHVGYILEFPNEMSLSFASGAGIRYRY